MKNPYKAARQKFKALSLRRQIALRTVFSFVVFALFISGMYSGWRWLYNQPEDSMGIQKPLRTVLDKNEQVFSKTISSDHLSKTYPVSKAAKKVRVNGNVGMQGEMDTSTWRLHLVRSPGDTLLLTLEDIKKLPKTDIVFDFKCIEGWDQVTHWGGVKFSDFAAYYHIPTDGAAKYMALITPDKQYYVGIDMPSAMHPQTLVCYEMNGLPLPQNQGYPLRLIIPCKYGIKHLKRIGTMYFTQQRPPDYWAERGYDYFSGL